MVWSGFIPNHSHYLIKRSSEHAVLPLHTVKSFSSDFLTELPQAPVSWCKIEAFITKPDYISVVKDLTPPPLVVMTICLRTLLNQKTHQNEVGFKILWNYCFLKFKVEALVLLFLFGIVFLEINWFIWKHWLMWYSCMCNLRDFFACSI